MELIRKGIDSHRKAIRERKIEQKITKVTKKKPKKCGIFLVS